MNNLIKLLSVSHRVILGFHLAALKHLAVGRVRVFLRTCNRAFRDTIRIRDYRLASIPEVPLEDILGDVTVKIQLPVTAYEKGMLPSHEAMALLSIVVSKQPTLVLEIGTYMGHTTKALAENLPQTVIHTVDLPLDFDPNIDLDGLPTKDDFHLIERRVVGREFINTPLSRQIVQHFCDTAVWDFAKAGRPDVFFVDGSHTYAHCKSDSEKCLQIASPGAIFLWHDCDEGHEGVVRFIFEWRLAGRSIQRIAGTSLAYWRMPAP